jgi:ArsR family transcriptional regulator
LKPDFDLAAIHYIQENEYMVRGHLDNYRLTAKLMKAIAHPARLRILYALSEDEECVCHLTALLHQRQAYVSQQLMFLRQAGLIEDRKDGLRVYYRIKNIGVIDVLDAVNKLTGARSISLESKVVAACPCPKCETAGRREGGSRWKSRSSVRVAPTA